MQIVKYLQYVVFLYESEDVMLIKNQNNIVKNAQNKIIIMPILFEKKTINV